MSCFRNRYWDHRYIGRENLLGSVCLFWCPDTVWCLFKIWRYKLRVIWVHVLIWMYPCYNNTYLLRILILDQYSYHWQDVHAIIFGNQRLLNSFVMSLQRLGAKSISPTLNSILQQTLQWIPLHLSIDSHMQCEYY